MKRTLTTALALLALTLPALAAPHPAYKPQKVDGIPTFKNSHAVGQMVFSLTDIDSKAKVAPASMPTLTFAKGSPPAKWYGRSYYPCSLSEGAKSIPYTTRNFQVATQIWIDGKMKQQNRFDVDDECKNWTTTAFDGDEYNSLLSDLEPGTHKLIVWRQLNYEVKTVYKETGAVTWEPGYISLSKGQLDLDVTE